LPTKVKLQLEHLARAAAGIGDTVAALAPDTVRTNQRIETKSPTQATVVRMKSTARTRTT